MGNLLLISGNPKTSASISEILSQHNLTAEVKQTAGESRRSMIENDYDMIIINAPLSDENGLELAADFAPRTDAGVLLLCPADYADQVVDKLEPYGVYVLAKPFNRQLLLQAIRFIAAGRQKLEIVRKSEQKLQKKLEELKKVSLAKCLLIEHIGLTESSAHRYIEKEAMDSRLPKIMIAEKIIDEYADE